FGAIHAMLVGLPERVFGDVAHRSFLRNTNTHSWVTRAPWFAPNRMRGVATVRASIHVHAPAFTDGTAATCHAETGCTSPSRTWSDTLRMNRPPGRTTRVTSRH